MWNIASFREGSIAAAAVDGRLVVSSVVAWTFLRCWEMAVSCIAAVGMVPIAAMAVGGRCPVAGLMNPAGDGVGEGRAELDGKPWALVVCADGGSIVVVAGDTPPPLVSCRSELA